MRILLIEDSQRLRHAVITGLRKEGYAIDGVADGNEGLWYATQYDYDAVILDLMLPGMDGLTLLKELRAKGGDRGSAHVIVLTARDTVEERVAGLRAGADDYMVKPFAFEELLARLEALTRRRHHLKNPVLHVDDLAIDTGARTVSRNGKTIDLSAREYALLQFLILRQGQVVSRSEIEAHLYDEHAEVMSNVIDAGVYSLRKKIDEPGKPSLIQTRRGMGYVLLGARQANHVASESPAQLAGTEGN